MTKNTIQGYQINMMVLAPGGARRDDFRLACTNLKTGLDSALARVPERVRKQMAIALGHLLESNGALLASGQTFNADSGGGRDGAPIVPYNIHDGYAHVVIRSTEVIA